MYSLLAFTYIFPRRFPYHLSLSNVESLAREIKSSAKANSDEVYYLYKTQAKFKNDFLITKTLLNMHFDFFYLV